MRKVIGGVVAVAALAATLTAYVLTGPSASAASGCSTHDRYTVCTTLPDGGPDPVIADEIQRQLQAVGDGDSVRATMYLWELEDGDDANPEEVADDLIGAHERGADVQLVVGAVDDLGQGDRNRVLIDLLTSEGIAVTECKDSCVEDRPDDRKGAMHNKFFLINNDGAKSILETSSNLSAGQVSKPQNMLVIRGDETLFDYYTGYWNRLNDRSWQGWTDSDKAQTGDYDLAKAYIFPRDEGNVVLERLDKMTQCDVTRNKIWVTASMDGNDAVRARLVEMQHDLGCDVRAVVSNTDVEAWLEASVDGQRLDPDKVRVLPHNHNKLILSDAYYAGKWRQTVFAGSHNQLNDGSLRYSDDVMLRVIQPDVFETYAAYFDEMYQAAD